jgi:glycosyltransferase involved in cell wall biosynthesis
MQRPNIQFFPLYSKEIEQTPFYKQLRQSGVSYEVFPYELFRTYKHRYELVLRIWPKMFWAAILCGVKSFRSTASNPWMIADTHIQVTVFALLRLLMRKRDRKIVLYGFLFNTANNRAGMSLRQIYMRWMIERTEIVVCHSKFEASSYASFLHLPAKKFTYLPWASGVPYPRIATCNAVSQKAYIVAAGRSWRDYATLISAIEGLPIDVKIICDSFDTLPNLKYPDNVEVLRNCFGDQYYATLQKCQFVVLPLSADQLSAGQMVLVQAFYFGKPVIITETKTVAEYVENGVTGLFVPMKDVASMRQAILKIIEDKELHSLLSRNATLKFDKYYSDEARVLGLERLLREWPNLSTSG